MVNRTKAVIGFTLVFVAMMWGVLVLRAYLNAGEQIAFCYLYRYEQDVFKSSFASCVGIKENELKGIETAKMAHILDRNPRARYLVRQRVERVKQIQMLIDVELHKWDSDFRIVRFAACVATLGPIRKIESSMKFLPGLIEFIVIIVTGLFYIYNVLYISSDISPKESEGTKQIISGGQDT